MTTRTALPTMFAASLQRAPLTGSARRRRLSAVVLALPPVLLLASCTSTEPEPVTAKVARASVSSSVTATGALQAIKEQRLGFPEGGRIVELNVAVGQQVEPGQILARIDDFAARKKLESAHARVAQEQAALARIRNGNQVTAAEDDVEQAEAVLEATEEQGNAVDRANSAAVKQAERRLAQDKEALEAAEDRAGCGEDAREGSRSDDEGREGWSGDEPGDGRQDGQDDERAGDDEGRGLIAPASQRGWDCDENPEVQAAERQVHASAAALDNAEQKQRIEAARHELAIANAKRDLATTRNKAEAARSDRPHSIDEQEATVAQLQADVDTAQRGVENTVLRAPVAGKIASINGTVGEFIGAGSGTTALAPGGTVPLPDSGPGVSSSSDLGDDGNRPGGSAFIVLDDVNTFQIVAPFTEADAALLSPNQAVEVTFDAVPDLTRTGNVVSIAPTGTDIQGVTSYYATIVLNEADPRLKDGLTASAHVIVDQVDNVLVVPNAAIQRSGSTGVVTVMEPDGTQRQVQVELGLEGDGVTQVVSGLREGQQIVVAQQEE